MIKTGSYFLFNNRRTSSRFPGGAVNAAALQILNGR
jgi:hypothetical protein